MSTRRPPIRLTLFALIVIVACLGIYLLGALDLFWSGDREPIFEPISFMIYWAGAAFVCTTIVLIAFVRDQKSTASRVALIIAGLCFFGAIHCVYVLRTLRF